MKTNNHYLIRSICYIFGFLIMTMGIALSVKSDLGVSPVSSIPYTMTCVFGIEMGRATILFHIGLVIIQIILLRKAFQIKNVLQIPVGILFGMFTTMCNSMAAMLPDPPNIEVRIAMILISTVLVAFGIFLYVPANFIPLAGEGTMLAVSQITKIKFSTVKIMFDVSMVIISLVTCLAMIHRLGSVGVGTVIAAFLVGIVLKGITKLLGSSRDRLLGIDKEQEETKATPLTDIMKKEVYTIDSNATIKETLSYFSSKKISGAPIVDKAGNMVGFISDGDILRWISSVESLFVYSDSSQETFNKNVADLMDRTVLEIGSKQVISVDSDADMAKVCSILSGKHLKKLPVLEDGRLVGVINASNIIKYMVSNI